VGFADDPERTHRSVLEGIPALEKPITCSEFKIPLGELVERVAADTGVRLTAGRDVADEPVEVVVDRMPAARLLEQLGDLLDYQWSRSGKQGSWRYEIHQDLAGRQREEAALQALYAKVEEQFRQEVQEYIRMAALPADRIRAIAAGVQPDEPRVRGGLTSSAVAADLYSPIRRGLAHLLGTLSPADWQTLIKGGRQISFSSDHGPGDRPLPSEALRAFAKSRPSLTRPGVVAFTNNSAAEEELRRLEAQWQQQWAAAAAYRVTVRLDVTPSAAVASGASLFSLIVVPAARSAGSPEFQSAPGEALAVNGRPADAVAEERAAEDTPQSHADGAADPILGVRRSWRSLTSQSGTPSHGTTDGEQPSGSKWSLWALLPKLARVYGVDFISDAYWTRGLTPPLQAPVSAAEPVSLFQLLRQSAWFTHHWDRSGRLIRLRSRMWFLDRPREVPLRLVRRWRALFDRLGALPLEEYVDTVAPLSDAQLASLQLVSWEAGLPPDFPSVDAARHALRLYAALSAGQRGALWSGKSLAVEQMTAPQLALLAAGAKGVGVPQGSEPVPPPLVGGAFWLTTVPFTRARDQTGTRNDDGEHFLLAPNEARSIGTSPVTQPQAAAAGSPPSGAPFRLTRVAFFLGGGSGPLGECQLTVSSPP